MLLSVVLSGLAIMLASLIGVIFLQKTAHEFLDKRLPYLVSFSAGVFLLTAGALAFEVFEIASGKS